MKLYFTAYDRNNMLQVATFGVEIVKTGWINQICIPGIGNVYFMFGRVFVVIGREKQNE